MTPAADRRRRAGGCGGGDRAGARAARRALLIERSREPHDVVCGGFLGWDALAELERLGIDVGGARRAADHAAAADRGRPDGRDRPALRCRRSLAADARRGLARCGGGGWARRSSAGVTAREASAGAGSHRRRRRTSPPRRCSSPPASMSCAGWRDLGEAAGADPAVGLRARLTPTPALGARARRDDRAASVRSRLCRAAAAGGRLDQPVPLGQALAARAGAGSAARGPCRRCAAAGRAHRGCRRDAPHGRRSPACPMAGAHGRRGRACSGSATRRR